MEATEDTLFGPFRIMLPAGPFQMQLSSTTAMQHFVEKNRIVFIWESRGACRQMNQDVEKFKNHERGWYGCPLFCFAWGEKKLLY